MRFNQFVWDLYKNSADGKKSIKLYTPVKDYSIPEYSVESDPVTITELKRKGLTKYITGSKVFWSKMFMDFFNSTGKPSIRNARDVFRKFVDTGVFIDSYSVIEPKSYNVWATDIHYLSGLLYSYFPDFYFPYILECEFDRFTQICKEFNIPLPEVPKKKDWEQRAMYYIDLCEALFEFRVYNNFTPGELCAFIYDFAEGVISGLEDSEMPDPSKVWFVGGHKGNFEELDNATNETSEHWQGNIDTRRGDIIVMYCLNPRSYVHSVWRADGNGFADPFFNWYNVVAITNPIKLKALITQKDLENNPLWSKNPLVRKNLQGINGYPIQYEEYLELLNMLQEKGQNIDILPRIKPTNKFSTDDLSEERDVEVKLIEPFLESLKYKPSDWIRQMPVKMGRGERNYPDYCFGANPKRGEETAEMILESKYEVKTNKDLREAYFQTKSYALRLQAKCFIIASKEGIWIFKPINMTYKYDDHFHYNWIDLENPDIFHKVFQQVGYKL